MSRYIKCKFCHIKFVWKGNRCTYPNLFTHLICEHWEKLPQGLIESWKEDTEKPVDRS